MHLFIRDMVCVRCRMVVEEIMGRLGIPYIKVELGWIEMEADLQPRQYEALQAELIHYQLGIIDNNKMILVERIKTTIRELIYCAGADQTLKFSVVLSQQLDYDYTYLSNVFSEVMGSTIERFYITLRVRRVKELLVYEGKNLKEIAFILNFSSVAHLCLQFKKITGKRPSEFRKKFMHAGLSIGDCE